MSLGTHIPNWRQATSCDCWWNPAPGGKRKQQPGGETVPSQELSPDANIGPWSQTSVVGVWFKACLLSPFISAPKLPSLGHEPRNQAYQPTDRLFFHGLCKLCCCYQWNQVCPWPPALQAVESSDLLLLCFLRVGQHFAWVSRAPNTRWAVCNCSQRWAGPSTAVYLDLQQMWKWLDIITVWWYTQNCWAFQWSSPHSEIKTEVLKVLLKVCSGQVRCNKAGAVLEKVQVWIFAQIWSKRSISFDG